MAMVRMRAAVLAAALACVASATAAGEPTVCDVRGDVTTASPVPPRVDENVDNCLLGGAALREPEWASATIVDARVAAGLRNPWIAGATTPTRADLAAASFGDARVVLVGNARDVRALADVCRSLQARGQSNVRVLAGGIAAWRRAGLPLEGDADLIDKPAFVGATDLQRAAAMPRALIVFDADADPALHALGAAGRVAGKRERRADAARRIARDFAREGVVPGIEPVTVVVADRGVGVEWVAAWRATPYADAQFYAGGGENYRLAVARGERIAADRYKPLPGPCDR